MAEGQPIQTLVPNPADEARREKLRAKWRRQYQHRKLDAGRYRDLLDANIRRSLKRAEWLDELKVQHGCTDCGFRDHFAALDFDHGAGEKAGEIWQMRRQCSKEKLLAEIARCEVVCGRCHRLRTLNSRPPLLDGTEPEPEGETKEGRKLRLQRCWRRRRRAEWNELTAGIKLARGCCECGWCEHAEALEFDHVRGSKLHAVSVLANRTWAKERLLEEMAKCDVVCVNCHRIRTYERRIESEKVRRLTQG